MIGQTLSHFRILRKIGEGGMGVVYEAEDVELQRRVALKVLRRDFLGKEDRRQRFLREARTAAQITHPHIATVYEVGEDDGETFIAMEFVEGQNLRQRIGGKPLPIDEAMRLAVQVAEGLAAAHEAQIVHRDLKPENVMIGPDGRARILDFGLAKPLEQPNPEDSDATVAISGEGRILGTVAYMAPEQARGLEVDGRSDHFSFGITLYEMLTGKPAFQGDTPSDTLTHILRDNPVPGIELNPEIPPELERILEKCLEKNPDDRYQDTRDLVVDLRRLVRDSGTGSGSGEHQSGWSTSVFGIPRDQKPPRKVPAAMVVAGVALLAVAAVFGVRMLPGSAGGGASLANSVAVMPFQNLQDPEDAERLGQILQELVIADLSGSTGLKVFSSQRLYDVQKQIGSSDRQFDRETASRIAEKVGAQTVLEGTLSKLGEKWILTATIIEADGGTVAGSCRIDGSDLYQMVDDLSRHLREEPRLAVAVPAADQDVREKTSGSLEAYRLYVVGADLLNQENYEAAADTLALAVAADPSFGKAYYKLAMAKWWATQLDAYSNEEAREPLRHLIDNELYANRQERLMAEAAYELIGKNWPDAKALYEQVCEIYPEDKEAWYGLGEAQFHGEMTPNEVTLASFERAVDLDPSFTVAYQHIFDCNARAGNPEASMERVHQFLEANPDREVGYRWWVEVAHAAGREPEMDRSLAAARQHVTDPTTWFKTLLAATRNSNERGDFRRGAQLLAEAKEASPEDVGFQWTILKTWTSGESSDFETTRELIAEIQEKWPEQASMVYDGIFELKLMDGDVEGARAYLAELRRSDHYEKVERKMIYADRLLGDELAFQMELSRQLDKADSESKRVDILNDVAWKEISHTGTCATARAWVEEALTHEPENGWVNTAMAWCNLRSGDLEAAEEYFRVASESQPGHIQPKIGIAAVHLARIQPAEAERICLEMLKGRVEAPVLRWLSIALAEQGRFEEAESAARRAASMHPSPVNKTHLAWALIAGDGDLEEGTRLATEALEIYAGMFKGETLFRQRHLELEFVPSPEHCLGLAAVKKGEIEKGIALLEEAAELRPDRLRIREDLQKARALL